MSKKIALIGLVMIAVMVLGFFSIANSQVKGKPLPGKAKPVIVKSQAEQVKRGEYLVILGGCNECHRPKRMTDAGPVPDKSLLLSGHPATQNIPAIPINIIGSDKWGALVTNDFTAWAGPWGVSFTFNLTPDNVTGIGAWTESVFIQAMHTGKHMGSGRPILPPMPWQEIGMAKDEDLKAIFAYLKSIPPISNQVPMPIPPADDKK
jgi:mono/diheme cytochrome c family protein